MWQFVLFEPFPVVQRGVIADGEARSLLVVELAVPVEGGVHTPLVRVQECGVRASPQHLPDIVQPVDVLVSGSPALGHLVGEQLLGEHLEVERDLEVEHPELENGHVGDDDLPGSVHCFPRGVDQVGVFVPLLARLALHHVRGLRPHPEEAEALVRVVVADADSHVDSDKGRCPAVPVCAVLQVHLLHGGDHLLTVDVAPRRVSLLPFVEAGPAHAHQLAQVVDVVVAGQQLDYFELLSFKRTYSGSPSAFI